MRISETSFEGKWKGPGETGEAVSVSCHSDPEMEVLRNAQDCQQLKKCSTRLSKKPQARVSCQRRFMSPRNGADLVQVQDSVVSLKNHGDGWAQPNTMEIFTILE